MGTLALSDILDDLRTADQALRKFEQRYWLSSDVFYDLYSRGLLDDGSNAEDFSEWAGHYRLRLKRESALKFFSERRIQHLQQTSSGSTVDLTVQEPVLEIA